MLMCNLHNPISSYIVLQSYLDSFVESVDSTYGCVFSNHGIVTATKNWFSLHPDEIVLLSLYLQSELWATLRDTPIFLPVKSPTVSKNIFIMNNESSEI